tara:strand:+ start:520 stop:666 length:147 start_codon:yes stop_codon:yes gene_type:complete
VKVVRKLLITSINPNHYIEKELIEVIKENSEPHCFNGGELNEGSEISG